MTAALHNEALLFGRYFLRETPSDQAMQLYQSLVTPHTMTAPDRKLLAFAVGHPRAIGLLDSGLALLRPHTELRRRLHVMYAVLESLPEYADHFLTVERSRWYAPYILWVCIRAVFKAAAGVVLVKCII